MALGAAPASASAPQRVPFGFVGTVIGSPLFPNESGQTDQADQTSFDGQLNRMVASGVESVRVVFEWPLVQPYKTWSQVPQDERSQFGSDGVDSVPTNFTALDGLVAAAAARHLTVMPTILDAPNWDGHAFPNGALNAPTQVGPYAEFCKVLVHRYGTHGTFWAGVAHPQPITRWQIWNEPNVPAFWPQQKGIHRYLALLRAAGTAIRGADHHAQIVLGGLANYSWRYLRGIYGVPGASRLFDIVGLHPYTRTPQDVVTILTYARDVMRREGDGAKPMMADEISWPSSIGHTVHDNGYDFATTQAGQARAIGQALPLLAANRQALGLIAIYYYTWVTTAVPNGSAFDFSGLFNVQGGTFAAKPAYGAFRHAALTLEHCQVKGAVATVCKRA